MRKFFCFYIPFVPYESNRESVTSAKRALLYLSLRLGLRKVPTRIFNKQDM